MDQPDRSNLTRAELGTYHLTSQQIRGARGMLDWSMMELASAAKVSVSTVKRAESSEPQPVSDNACFALREALEAADVRFLDDDHSISIRLLHR